MPRTVLGEYNSEQNGHTKIPVPCGPYSLVNRGKQQFVKWW